jgi:hypothetical protein
MKVEKICCDVCGKLKGEANKWLKAFVSESGQSITIMGLGEMICGDETKDICSNTCLQKLLGGVLEKIQAQ